MMNGGKRESLLAIGNHIYRKQCRDRSAAPALVLVTLATGLINYLEKSRYLAINGCSRQLGQDAPEWPDSGTEIPGANGLNSIDGEGNLVWIFLTSFSFAMDIFGTANYTSP